MRPKTRDIWLKTGMRCIYCGLDKDQVIAMNPAVNVCTLLTVDHIVPKSKGGTRHPGNLLPACSRCNTRRASCWPPSDYAHPQFVELVKAAEQHAELNQGNYQRLQPTVREMPPRLGSWTWKKTRAERKAIREARLRKRMEERRKPLLAGLHPDLLDALEKLKALSTP